MKKLKHQRKVMPNSVVANRKSIGFVFEKNNCIYIGRTAQTTGHPNLLSNPYEIGRDGTREEVIQKFAYDFRVKWRLNLDFKKSIMECSGKTLVCSCSPKMCHGDVIACFINAYNREGSEDDAFESIQKYIYNYKVEY